MTTTGILMTVALAVIDSATIAYLIENRKVIRARLHLDERYRTWMDPEKYAEY